MLDRDALEEITLDDLVSIVVPVYGVEKYLENCVKSILRQTYKKLEIILIDDGSPDKCGEMCDAYAARDNRVQVIHKENGGLSDARNVGIKKATGEYVTCIDSDDYVSADYVEHLIRLTKTHNADISICGLKKTDISNEKTDERDFTEVVEILTPYEALIEMLYAKKFSTSVCGRLFKRSILQGIEFPLNKYSEDMFTMYKIILNANKVVFSNKMGYFYYCRPESIMTESFQKKHLDVVDALHQIKEDVIAESDHLLSAYKNQIVEVTAMILGKKPPVEYFLDNGLWAEARSYCSSVVTDKRASKRVRAQALLMLFGWRMAGSVIHTYYEYKWRRNCN